MTASRDPRIVSILEALLERIAADPPAADALVASVCNEHPELADDLRRHVEALRRFGMLVEPSPRAVPTVPALLGDFALREPLGGGGMGVVYRAEQVSLGREVALKIVRPEQLFFPGARERFLREVAIVAKLSHPGIVPVYTVGEQGGIPYYAMELVRGCTLAQAIEELSIRRPETLAASDLRAAVLRRSPPSNWTTAAEAPPNAPREGFLDACLRLIAEVAVALDHAHSRGVVHRDVKPSNIMVTPEGRVMLLDFGLASSEESSRVTRSGSQLGSLPYMAPEQVRGETRAIDARTDVYQLGVTLFELLTLRLPFAQEGAEATRRAILEGSPTTLRVLNGRVPWDVETVCLTAMERDATRRYDSAAAFARDLHHLLARRPIEAQRPGALLRLRRFAQRRPATTVGALLGLLIVVGGPIGYALFERGARRRVEVQQELTNAQASRARGHFRRVLDAVDRLLEPLLRDDSEQVPEMASLRREVLERALLVYEGFDADDRSDPELRGDRARASAQLGDIRFALRENELAVADLELAIAELDDLHRQRPDDERLVLRLGRALSLAGRIEASSGRTVDGIAKLRRSIAAFDALPAAARSEREFAYAIADAQSGLGYRLMASGSAAEGESCLKAAIEGAEALVASDPADASARELLASVKHELALPLGYDRTGARRGEAIRLLEECCAEEREILRRRPEARDVRQDLAKALIDLGTILNTAGECERAAALFGESMALLEGLRTRFPEIPAYDSDLSLALNGLGSTHSRRGRFAEADPFFARTCELERGMIARDPGNPARHVHLAVFLARHADNQRKIGRPKEALASYDEAIVEMTAGMAAGAQDVRGDVMMRPWRWSRAAAQVDVGAVDAAAEAVRELVAESASVDDLRRAVTVLAGCARRIATSEALGEEERTRQARRFEEQAIERLAAALGNGFRPSADFFADAGVARLLSRHEVREQLKAAGIDPPSVADER